MKNIKIIALVLAVAALFAVPAVAEARSKFSFSVNLDCAPKFQCHPPVVYGPPVIEQRIIMPAPLPPPCSPCPFYQDFGFMFFHS